MGLLDDAIREHLELKRLRGADPGEVAREEQEALGPVYRDDATHDQQDHVERDGAYDELPARDLEVPGLDERNDVISDGRLISGEETVEIDMSRILDPAVQDDRVAPAGPPDHEGTVHLGPATRALDANESLEWGIPDERDDEGDVVYRKNINAEADGSDDVLEETPDFLRETPEQERLWFEQRPPRDFDFNE